MHILQTPDIISRTKHAMQPHDDDNHYWAPAMNAWIHVFTWMLHYGVSEKMNVVME
jgi:hypothetical protein